MAKIKKIVVCPDCNYKHTIYVEIPTPPKTTTAGIRGRRVTGNQVEYALNVPGEISEGDIFWSIGDQMLGVYVVGALEGVLCGYIVSQVAYYVVGAADLLQIQIIIGGGLAGIFYNMRWLFLERAWQLGEWLPAMVGRYFEVSPQSGDIDLTIDHRYRDGQTEAGRTIQYFGVLPVEVERFNEWGRAALRGDSLAIAQWTGQGKLFSRPEYDRLLDLMRRGGSVVNVPGKGNQLTGGGRRALSRHLKQPPPPPPPERA